MWDKNKEDYDFEDNYGHNNNNRNEKKLHGEESRASRQYFLFIFMRSLVQISASR